MIFWSFRAMPLPIAAYWQLVHGKHSKISSQKRATGAFYARNGAAKKNRTSDPVITNDVLYH
jgi:hypothetical protein